MKFSKTILAAATATGLLIGAPAMAGTVKLGYEVAGTAYGAEGWYQSVTQTVLDRGAPVGQTYRGTAGAFRLTDGLTAIMTFCIDPYSYLNLRKNFEVTEGATVLENIDKLFTSSFADVKDACTYDGCPQSCTLIELLPSKIECR